MENTQQTNQEQNTIDIVLNKRAGAFTHLVYEREIELAKKYGQIGRITSILDMIGRTGCNWNNIQQAMEKAKERLEKGETKRVYAGPQPIAQNRIYQAKDGSILIRFYPIKVKSRYFLDGNEIELDKLMAMLPEGALKINKTQIMSLKLKGIKFIK